MRVLRAALLPFAVFGCSSEPVTLLDHPLESGGRLIQRVATDSPSVVLVIRPADLAACGTHIARWAEWGRQNPGRFTLVTADSPDPASRKQLLLYRIAPDATLAPSTLADTISTPREYLVANGRVVYSDVAPAGSPESPLLDALEEGQVATLLQSR